MDFFAIDHDFFGRRNAEAHLLAFDAQDSDNNVVANEEGFGRAVG